VGSARRQSERALLKNLIGFTKALGACLIVTIALCVATLASAPRPADYFGPEEIRHATLGGLEP
jgi:hypothetical protein